MTSKSPDGKPPSTSLGGKLARASIWSISGKIGAKFFDLLSLVVLTHLLTPEDFGLVAKAMSVILILETVTAMPIGQPILRIKDPEKAVYDTAFTLAMFRSLLLFIAILALAQPLAWYFKEPRLPLLLITLSLAPILRGSISPRMTEFSRVYNLRPEAYGDLLSKLASFVVVVAVAYMTSSHWSIVAGTVMTTVVLFTYTYIVAPYRPAFGLRYWHSFADVLGWNTVVQIVQTISWQLDAILLGRALPTAIFGRYSVSRNLNDIPQQALALPLMRPMIMSFSSAESDERRQNLWLKFSNTVLYIVGPILLTMALLSDATVQVLLGAKFSGAGVFLFGLALAGIPKLPGLPLNYLAVSMHRSRVMATRMMVQLAVMLPLMIAGLQLGGVIGVLIAKAGIELIMAAVSMVYIRKLIGLGIGTQCAAVVRTVAGLFVMSAALYMLRSVLIGPLETTPRLLLAGQAFATFVISACVYVVFTCGLWVLFGRPQGIEAMIAGKTRAIKARLIG